MSKIIDIKTRKEISCITDNKKSNTEFNEKRPIRQKVNDILNDWKQMNKDLRKQ